MLLNATEMLTVISTLKAFELPSSVCQLFSFISFK